MTAPCGQHDVYRVPLVTWPYKTIPSAANRIRTLLQVFFLPPPDNLFFIAFLAVSGHSETFWPIKNKSTFDRTLYDQ